MFFPDWREVGEEEKEEEEAQEKWQRIKKENHHHQTHANIFEEILRNMSSKLYCESEAYASDSQKSFEDMFPGNLLIITHVDLKWSNCEREVCF